ncbi:MAG: lytic murein transglycosylase [Myxococcaceae bacterium]
MLALAVTVLLAATDGGTSDAGTPDAGSTDGGWRLSQKLGDGSAARKSLTEELALRAPPLQDGGSNGEAPLTAAEVSAILDDPRAQLIYAEKTVSIVAPSMPARHRQEHLDLMKLFLKPERLQAGAVFAKQQQQYLEAAETKTGVQREVIIAILMWESKLGTITGDYFAFNVFTSQAYFIDEANEAALAMKEEQKLYDPKLQKQRVETIRARAHMNLLALLRQCKTKKIDPLAVKGSWAGALGFPQFMPASLRWADDGDADGRIDLFTMPDAIASIGRYLKEHGFADSREKAVWEYNHEDAYVKGVLAYADALHEQLHADAGVPGKKKK